MKIKNNNVWKLFLLVFFLILICPFLLKLLFTAIGKEIYTFNLSFTDFINTWITLWSVFGAAIGLYLVQKKIDISRAQHSEQIKTQQEHLKIQIQEGYRVRYSNCIELLNNDNEIIRLQSINNMYLLALENPKDYLSIICNSFCDIITSKCKKYSQKEIQRVFKYLFVDEPRIFDQVRKDINNCQLTNLMITNAHINNTNLNNSIIDDCKIHNTKITNSNFIGTTLKKTVFRTTSFKNVIFRRAIMSDNTTFSRLTINGALFNQSTLNSVFFDDVQISNSDFSDAKMMKSSLTNLKFVQCHLEFDDINDTRLIFVNHNYLNDFKKMLPSKYNKVLHIQGGVIYIP